MNKKSQNVSMIDIRKFIKENEQTAISILKEHNGHIVFDKDEKHFYMLDSRPYIILSLDYTINELQEVKVNEVRLRANKIEMKCEMLKEWMGVYKCCGMTANNIYKAIGEHAKNK